MGCVRQQGDSEKLKASQSHIKNGHALNSYLPIFANNIFQTICPLEQKPGGWHQPNKQNAYTLHSDTKDGHVHYSLYEIL